MKDYRPLKSELIAMEALRRGVITRGRNERHFRFGRRRFNPATIYGLVDRGEAVIMPGNTVRGVTQ